MIICFVCDVLGRKNNGTTIAAMNLIESLRKKGHTVRVVCPDESRRGEKDYYIVPKLYVGPFKGYVEKNGVTIARSDDEVLRQALDGADHLHVLLPFFLGIHAMRLAKKAGLPVTASFHCQAENLTSHMFLKNSKLANQETYKLFYHNFYQYVDAIHYPSEFIRDTFEHYVGKTNGYVISNGVGSEFVPQQVERPKELEEKRAILFTGRFSKEKSHTLLIDAVRLSRHKDEIQLVFAGDGPLKAKLEAYSSDLPNPPIFGFFSRQELLRVINSCDLYVHPAEIEIEAIACLEAISCGLVPVINNSPRSATRYFALDEKNLFACNDVADLAEKMDYWLEHPEEKAVRSKEYLGYTKQFDFALCMDRMEQMILETHAKVSQRGNHGKENDLLQ
jgi:glycosyltransferase involved in cell wall biosynthesis